MYVLSSSASPPTPPNVFQCILIRYVELAEIYLHRPVIFAIRQH